MRTINIPIKKGQWLSEALRLRGYINIPTNVILKKTLPGLGATYMEIKARRHSIIIEPNVPVILGKTKGNLKLLAVWESCTKTQIKNYLTDSTIRHKKLLTTPEGFKKIKEVCSRKDVKIDIYNDFFCLFDECEKTVQDVDFRNSIVQPINDFFLFKNKAFVSATPVSMSHPEFENQKFYILKVKPLYNYRKNLDLIETDNYEMEVLQKFKALRNSDCVCVFLNKTDSIEKLVHTLGIKDESKIFCSDKSVKKLKNLDYTDVFDQIDLPLAKYNFFTCRFFSAVDIEIQQKPDIVLLTNLNDAAHTMIDPFTEAIQIYGRFRDKYHRGQIPFNSLTHITNIKPDMVAYRRPEVDAIIQTDKLTYDTINNRLQNETNPIARKALERDLRKLNYTELLDENGMLNYFSLDNKYYAELVKRHYTDGDWLRRMYHATGHFIVNYSVRHYPFTSVFQSANLTATEKRELIVLNLEKLEQEKINNPTFDIEPYKNTWRKEIITDRESGDLMVDAYYYLGKTIIENIGYRKPAILKKATDMEKAKAKEEQLRSIILMAISQQYPIGRKDTKNNIRDFLQEVYRLNGIDINVTQITIEEYCQTTSSNSDNPATYTIQGYIL